MRESKLLEIASFYDLLLAISFCLPLAFLLYFFYVYIRWKYGSKPDDRFSTDYWYTKKNPLHRTWWPIVTILIYFLIVMLIGILGE